MMTLQQNAQSPLLQLGKPKDLSHGMKIYSTTEQLTFKIMDVQTPFGPSVFNGTGDEERQSLVLSVSPDDHKALSALETSLRQQLQAQFPDLDSRWTSCLKDATDKFAPTLRCKINLKGARVCKFLDGAGAPASPPESWRRLQANVVIRIGGAYLQARGAGLLVEATHLQYEPQLPENPFA
jgi:hypothetical protein